MMGTLMMRKFYIPIAFNITTSELRAVLNNVRLDQSGTKIGHNWQTHNLYPAWYKKPRSWWIK